MQCEPDASIRRTRAGRVSKPRPLWHTYHTGTNAITGKRQVLVPCGRSDDELGTLTSNPDALRELAEWCEQAAAWIEDCPSVSDAPAVSDAP